MALDAKNNLLYVANHGSVHRVQAPEAGRAKRGETPGWPLTRDDAVLGSGQTLPPSITVYSKDAKGDALPLRVIQGPKTQMNWPTGVAIDPDRNELFIAMTAEIPSWCLMPTRAATRLLSASLKALAAW